MPLSHDTLPLNRDNPLPLSASGAAADACAGTMAGTSSRDFGAFTSKHQRKLPPSPPTRTNQNERVVNITPRNGSELRATQRAHKHASLGKIFHLTTHSLLPHFDQNTTLLYLRAHSSSTPPSFLHSPTQVRSWSMSPPQPIYRRQNDRAVILSSLSPNTAARF